MSDTKKVASPVAIKLNFFLVAALLLAALYYASSLSIITMALALTSAGIALAVHKRLRAGYFACAAVCFGLFWLARTGQEFVGAKSLVMGLSLPVMVLALYLHEQFVPKQIDKDERNCV